MNKPLQSVPKPLGRRSTRRKPDGRVLRTRRQLGVALMELMLAHDYADITVQQVLDRAKVGRATFYAHFRNKPDLLFSDGERYLSHLDAAFSASARGTRRLAPVAELLAHVADYADFGRALHRAGLSNPMMALFTGYLARIIQARLEALGACVAGALTPAATSRVLAGALIEMLRWWSERVDRPRPDAMDVEFHAIAWGGLSGLLSAR